MESVEFISSLGRAGCLTEESIRFMVLLSDKGEVDEGKEIQSKMRATRIRTRAR